MGNSKIFSLCVSGTVPDRENLNFEAKHLSKSHFIMRTPHGLPWD